ncbi:hypothetical protein KY284_034308 [Solanum tuberosum]|nr:hypothetical protein KY284_034308 [Solanum tuberosum]
MPRDRDDEGRPTLYRDCGNGPHSHKTLRPRPSQMRPRGTQLRRATWSAPADAYNWFGQVPKLI